MQLRREIIKNIILVQNNLQFSSNLKKNILFNLTTMLFGFI